MKVLVIGGTRFVGLRLVRLLAREGHDVTILNRGRTQAELPSAVKRLYADRRNPDELYRVLKAPDFEVVYDITGHSGHYSDMAIANIRHRPFEDVSRIISGEWPRGWVNSAVEAEYLARWVKTK